MHSIDLSKWLLEILKCSNKFCPIYNVGSDKDIELNELIKKLLQNLEKTKSKNYNSRQIDYYVPNINKAKKDLKLKIDINLNQSINSTIKTFMTKISIVTPTYNEEANIEKLCSEIKNEMKKFNYEYEHIIIDNSSTDNTIKKLRKICLDDKNVKVIINTKILAI